jgi:hypothetical protein
MSSSGYAVGWGALALINAGLAQGKGRPGALWFLVSLLLGPIATLMIVLLPRMAIDPVTNTGGWRPRPFERLDWMVLGVLVAVILATLILLAFPNLVHGSRV